MSVCKHSCDALDSHVFLRLEFPGSETPTMINCENLIQRMVSLYFNKVYVISVTKIEEIAYAIHKGFSRRRLCEKYARRKVNNVPEINFR